MIGRTLTAVVATGLALMAAAPAWPQVRPAAAPAAGLTVTAPWESTRGPSAYAPLPRQDMLISGATVLDGAGGRFVGDVLVRNGQVTAAAVAIAPPAGVAVVDGRGRWLTPGLVDIHTHYGTYLLPQASEGSATDVLENSDPNVAETWIEHAVRPVDPAFSRALASGVTTVQILPGSGALFGGRTVVVKPVPAVTLEGMRFPAAPRGLKMACGGNPANSFGERGRAPNSRQGEIAMIRRDFLEARRYAAEWDRHLRDGGGKAEPKRDLRQDSLVAAMRGQAPVHLHCYRADDIATWIQVLAEFDVHLTAVHHATEAYKIAPLLAERGVCAAVWSDWWGFKREAEDGIRENAAFVDAAGGCAMLHSDIPLLGALLNLETAKAAAAGRRAGLAIPPEHAIRWITSNPAKALGLGDRIGRISPGYNADLVLWSADPFSVYAHPDRVYIDGALAYDRAEHGPRPTPDFELGRPQREPAR